MEELKVGDLIEFKFSKNGKWSEGRIDRIEPYENQKAIYSIEEYCLVQPIYLERVVNQSDEDWREWNKSKWVMKWCFVKWFSKDYLRKKVLEETLT